MSTVAELVARLIAAGTAPEVAAMVVTEAFAAGAASAVSGGSPVDIAAEKRRAYDRERKAKQREEMRKSGGSPVDIRGTSENAISLSSPPKDSDSKEGKKRNSRGEKLPPDWTPNESHYAEGEGRGFSRQQVDSFAQDMRLWAESNQHRAVARKSNWDLTFLAWVRRQGRALGPPGATPQPRTVREQAAVVWKNAIDNLDNLILPRTEISGGGGSQAALPFIPATDAKPRS